MDTIQPSRHAARLMIKAPKEYAQLLEHCSKKPKPIDNFPMTECRTLVNIIADSKKARKFILTNCPLDYAYLCGFVKVPFDAAAAKEIMIRALVSNSIGW